MLATSESRHDLHFEKMRNSRGIRCSNFGEMNRYLPLKRLTSEPWIPAMLSTSTSTVVIKSGQHKQSNYQLEQTTSAKPASTLFLRNGNCRTRPSGAERMSCDTVRCVQNINAAHPGCSPRDYRCNCSAGSVSLSPLRT